MNCIPLSAAEFALQARLLQLPVALSMDLRLSAHEHVLRRDLAHGTVQGVAASIVAATILSGRRPGTPSDEARS
jgi:hypothetical protein